MIKGKSPNNIKLKFRNVTTVNQLEKKAMWISLWLAVFWSGISFSHSQPTATTCKEPPTIPSASISQPLLTEYPVGADVTYICNFGFIPDSNSRRTSQCVLSEDGSATWTRIDMSCKPRSCGDPGYVVNGHRIGSLFTFPHSVTYECEEGYKIRGNSKRYCQASGLWSGKLPTCEAVSCQPPEHPKNGRAIYTSLDYGSELQLECEKGYKPESRSPIVCTVDGEWSEIVNCVEVNCGMPEPPEYGSVGLISATSHPQEGSIAVFTCEDGRVLNGAPTSKCLDIGEWTFPTPKCIEPCTVPVVPNGKIGRWVPSGNKRSSRFEVIEVGTRLQDDEKIFLHCNKDYDPLGSENWQAMIVCRKGKWVEQPHCEPKSCRRLPAFSENLEVVEITGKHGSRMIYQCAPDFKMVQEGDLVCEFGKWIGNPPICKDTRCSFSSLGFNSLKIKNNQMYLKSGERYQIECNEGYEISSRGDGMMHCEDGSWKGPMPPCVPAKCSEPPPQIEHGKIESYNSIHGSIVKYVCDDMYIMTDSAKVECLFGEWKGDPPKCKDSRCYMKNLKYRRGVSNESKSFTISGQKLDVVCDSGFIRTRRPSPSCHDGQWSSFTESPCTEKYCIVERIGNGIMQVEKRGNAKWNYWQFRYEQPAIYYENALLGSTVSHGSTLHFSCSGINTFQGKGLHKKVLITCNKGDWVPDPICLRTGTVYRPSTTNQPKVATTRRTSVPERKVVSMSSIIPTEVITATTKKGGDYENYVPTIPNAHIESSVQEDECSCEMEVNDDDIVAYVDDRQLKFHDRVKNGTTIKFRCKDVGVQRLAGPEEITCQNCIPWHSSEFPSCTQPIRGDTVILFVEDKVNVTLNGSLEVLKQEEIELICIAIEEAEYPVWEVPAVSRAQISQEQMDRGSDVLFVTHLTIEKPEFEDSGWYNCEVGKSRRTSVHISVMDHSIRCGKFLENEELVVEHDEELIPKSKAMFSCRKPHQVLVGIPILMCLSNGQWSDDPPHCENITCPELKQTDLMRIAYTNQQEVGSFASFHCFSPGQREGVARTRCLENGHWEDPIPTCKTPPCVMDDLFSKLPQRVKPFMQEVNNDTFPYNHTIKLVCLEGRTLVGDSLARCGKNGEWTIGTMQCVVGCGEIEKQPGSTLIVAPQRDEYRIGHYITFSCPPGQRLTKNLEMIMCLSSGWSEFDLPDCEDVSVEEQEAEETMD